MQTNLAADISSRQEHKEIESILRSCVHCGFCNATCPTYQLTGNELDGPRGRIYLLKQMLEGGAISAITQQHLDRCLNCQSCETTCPSGVEYGRLLDLGRVVLEQKINRPAWEQIKRQFMLLIFPNRTLFNALMKVANVFRPLVPEQYRNKLPLEKVLKNWPAAIHNRKILLFPGCVQSILAPELDVAAARVLDKLGISLIKVEVVSCCGALNYHLADDEQAKQLAKNNIDAYWPYVNQEIEAIIMTSSGCGVMIKDYARLLQYDADYAEKARIFSAKVKDISEVINQEELSVFNSNKQKIAFQSPCSLQHGQQLNSVVENILEKIGFTLTAVENAHLCCGSAGVYSLLQKQMSEQLKDNKLQSLQQGAPDIISTANIGCLMHLREQAEVDVVHWLELLDGK